MILRLLLQQCLERDPSVPGSVWLSEWQGAHVQNRQGKQQGERGGNGTREVGPARRGEARQREPGAKRNEVEMKSCEQEGETGFGANSKERLNMASKICAKHSGIWPSCSCSCSASAAFLFPRQGWWEWGITRWEEHGKGTHRATKDISPKISGSSHWRE